MSVYVGIDGHRKRSQIAVVDHDGAVQVNRHVPNGVETVLSVIGDLPIGAPVAFEAASGWGWLVELLEDYGFEPHLVHPLRCKAIASDRLKNDKVDAATLAQLLRADLLPEAWIARLQVRQQWAPLRHRCQLVRLRTLLRNRVHAVLADYGCDRSGAASPLRGGAGSTAWTCRTPPAAWSTIFWSRWTLSKEPLDAPDQQLVAHARGDPRVKTPTRLPGVGTLTARIIVAEIGDVSRFPSARKLTAWAGLTPTVRSSDLTVRHGHISKQGSDWLRWILCEAARTAKRSPEFAASHQRLARRRGKKIATTAIARRLPARACHLLRAVQAQRDRRGAR
ncbi:IS110 family transposase [Streptomyces sp. NPDC052101]|uniref:IS110 family transposase n=1 Tax=Streptomyces sp. NPDC052101 TaxID=3155763 RepID=UPI003435860D